MKKIELGGKYGNGKFAIVDDEDYEFVNQFKWHVVGGYAVRCERLNGNKRTVFMHRTIADTPSDMVTDHINRDTLDNRKANLRNCDRQKNVANRVLKKKTISGLIGVRDRKNGSYQSAIMKDKKVIHLGEFKSKFLAGVSYDLAALRIHGDYAVLNFPQIAKSCFSWSYAPDERKQIR